ncbi:MAG: PIN domain-containing protein [Chitinophagaceae bacterium]
MGLILADTNIVIYTLKGIPAIQQYVDNDFGLSDISVIELLGVKSIDDTIFTARKAYIDAAYIYPLNESIRQIAIKLKQRYILKVPDAIIAATAIHYDIPLLTADKGFVRLKELSAIIISLV